MLINCISDTHGSHNLLPDLIPGDVLVVAGDFTGYGTSKEVKKFNKWLHKQPYKDIVVIAGNHDGCMQNPEYHKLFTDNVHYLHDSSIVIDGVKFYGSPYTPIFMNWFFMEDEGDLAKRWEKIPTDTDILITHGPMYQIMDYVDNDYKPERHVGSVSLLKKVSSFYPKWHICGHIHSGHGVDTICDMAQKRQTHCINASVLDEDYNIAYDPISFNV